MSVPTRLFADWSPDPSRPVSSQANASGGACHWSSLRQNNDTQQLADRARSYILTMLHQDPDTGHRGR